LGDGHREFVCTGKPSQGEASEPWALALNTVLSQFAGRPTTAYALTADCSTPREADESIGELSICLGEAPTTPELHQAAQHRWWNVRSRARTSRKIRHTMGSKTGCRGLIPVTRRPWRRILLLVRYVCRSGLYDGEPQFVGRLRTELHTFLDDRLAVLKRLAEMVERSSPRR